MDIKHLESYINKVIEDSCAAEQRTNDVKWEYMIIDNDILLFAIKSKFQRVRRRVLYRLNNNLKRNFGLNFNLVIPDSLYESMDCHNARTCDLYGGRSTDVNNLDPNHSFMIATFFGKRYTVRTLWGIRPDEELGLPHLNKLKEHGFDYEVDGDWDKFSRAYEAAYGESLMEGFHKVRVFWEAKKKEENEKRVKENECAKTSQLEECHRRQYEKDEERHGCGYWSVCDERACPCSPGAPVSQGFNEETWQSLKKSWERSIGDMHWEH